MQKTIKYIKRCFTAVLTVIMLNIVFSSCAVKEPDYLFYQNYPFTVTAEITIDSFKCTVKAELDDKNSGCITYLAPDTLKDIAFLSGADGVYISYDGMKIPLSSKSDADFLIFLSLFSLDETHFSGAEIIEKNSEKLNLAVFKTNAGIVNVYIDPISGLPTKISSELYGHSIEVTVTDFKYGDKSETAENESN